MAAVEDGRFSIPEIARLFQVSVTFIKKMLQLHRAGEPLDPRHGGGPVPVLQEQETTLLRQELQARPDATLAELRMDGIRTALSVPGAIDGETMLFFVEELLVPTLKRGDIVLMDNNPIHKLDDIEAAIAAVGVWILFLPTYSPDLNPIENCWSKVKSRPRSLKPRTLPDFLDA